MLEIQGFWDLKVLSCIQKCFKVPLLKIQRSQKLLKSNILALIIIYDWGTCTQNLEDVPPPPLVKHNSCQSKYSPRTKRFFIHMWLGKLKKIFTMRALSACNWWGDHDMFFWKKLEPCLLFIAYQYNCSYNSQFANSPIPNLDIQSSDFFTDLVSQPIS